MTFDELAASRLKPDMVPRGDFRTAIIYDSSLVDESNTHEAWKLCNARDAALHRLAVRALRRDD